MINLGFHSGKNTPPVFLPPALPDRIMEIVSALIVISTWILAIVIYMRYSVPSMPLFAAPIAMTCATAAFLFAGRAPIRYYNFPVKLTERNSMIQLFLARRFLRVVGIIVNLLLLCVVMSEAEYLFDVQTELFTIVTFAFSGLIMCAFVIYYIFAFRYK